MQTRLTYALVLCLAGNAAASGTVQRAPPEVAVKDRWLISLRSDVKPEQVALLAQQLAGVNGRVSAVWVSALRGFLIELPDALAPSLAEHPWVERVVQDRRFLQPFSTPIDDCSIGISVSGPTPASLPQSITCADPDPQNAAATCVDNWGLDRLDGLTSTRDGIYNPPRTGVGVHLFIIDSGLYAQHQDFAGRVGAGFDATGTGGTQDCDSWSHGSHVAGIAAGARFGVAKGATLHPVRVATCPVAIQLSYLVTAFDWIAQVHGTSITGPAVASISINSTATDFTDPSSLLNTAITGVLNAGVLVIQSAGNNLGDACGHVSRAPGVLIVGGSDEFDTPWERVPADPNYAGWCGSGGDCGSNHGPCVSLFAPAAHVVSSWYGTPSDPRNMCRLSGTSMAAPHAAGVAALYLQARPTATPAQLRQGLLDQALPVLSALPASTTNKLVSVVEGVAAANVTPVSVDFGAGRVGRTTAPRRVVVASTGALPLSLTAGVSGLHSTDFGVGGCAQPIAPMSSCTLSVTFSPTRAGSRTASLSISTNDPARPTIVIALQGTAEDPQLTVVLEGAGTGLVESTPAGISCGTACSATFSEGTNLTLTATPSPGSVFSGWSGAGTGSLVLADSITLVATFSRTAHDAGSVLDAGVNETPPDGGGTVMRVQGAGGCGCEATDFPAVFWAALAWLVGARWRRPGRDWRTGCTSLLHGRRTSPNGLEAGTVAGSARDVLARCVQVRRSSAARRARSDSSRNGGSGTR